MTAAELERLAAIEHQRWSDWQRWMHDLCARNPDGSLTIPAVLVQRWERQIVTPYEQLSEQEKQADRQQVLRYFPDGCISTPPESASTLQRYDGRADGDG